jgi:hypothetical protein
MNCWKFGLTVGLFAIIVPAARAGQSVYTATHGSSCVDHSRAELGAWRCPGPKGYVAEYTDEGNLAGISIRALTAKRQASLSISWRGSGKVFGDMLEWRVDAGQPKAVILRRWRVETAADGAEHEVEELLLLKVLPAGACHVASINARQAGANQMAQEQSERVSSLPCLKEE